MIKYDRLWQTMKDRGVTQYALYTRYNVNRSQIDRLRKNPECRGQHHRQTLQHPKLQG